MTRTNIERPFWLKPPWQILFDLVKLHKLRPWDVNITHLLSSFLSEMQNRGYIDFAVSGTALYSSSLILRLQSELIMKLEEPPKPPEEKPIEHIPPPLQLPFRYEFTSTTLDNLLDALEEVIRSEAERKPIKLTPIVAPPLDFFREYDRFFIEIESKLDEFYDQLKVMLKGRAMPFSKIVANKPRSEVIRVFLLLLFLAAKGRLQLGQKEEFGEIYVMLTMRSDKFGQYLTV